MRTRRIVALSLLACAIAVTAILPAAPALAAPGQKEQNTASQSYYRLDVPNGTVAARIEATVQNASSKDMTTAVLWAMPQAQNIAVSRDDTPLETKVTPFSDELGLPTLVQVTLPRALKTKAQMDLVMTYDVPAQSSKLVRLEPGATEALFVSQGPGSFVLLDLPAQAENVLDPGCLKAADQPGDVKAAGLERWVCGEVSLIAMATDDPDLLKRCAALDDRCRQRLDLSPFSAFVQSISDPSLQAVLTDTVQLSGGNVKLELRFFKREQEWATRTFEVAKAALPKLEALFGFSYPNDSIVMRQSHHIESVGAAGVAFTKSGQVLLSTDTGSDDEVTVHELAHQWASRAKHFTDSYMSEGLAEFAARALAPELGYTPVNWGWESYGYTDGVATWRNGSAIANGNYWYGKSGAFWAAYEAAIGGRQNMTRVLSLVDDYEKEWPLKGEWFLDRGEEISGANLDELFLGWVYNRETAAPLLAERRAAHDAVAPLRARAGELGFEGIPVDLQANLDQWAFRAIAGQIADANRLLDEYGLLQAKAAEAGLPPIDNVKMSWGTHAIHETRVVLNDQQQAVEAIVNSTIALASESPDSPSLKELAEARAKYAAGDLDEAARLAAQAATTSFNEDASVKLIALAKDKQSHFHKSFLGRIGLMGKDPDGQLRKAEEAVAAGDPNLAMELAQSAFEAWDGAERTGVQRLAILMGLMCLLSAGVWWLLKRLEDEPVLEVTRDPYAATGGHNLGDAEARRPGWRDWENTK